VVPGGAIPLARQLARRFRGTAVVLDGERDMARVVLGPWTVDLAAQAGPSLLSDLGRRDYCLNAMALPLAPGAPLLDPCGGLADLTAGQIRAVGEANLLADPLRLLRGPRLAAELGFELAPATRELVARHGSALAQVAPERVLAELEKLAHCPGGSQGLGLALGLGLLAPWLTALGGFDPLALLPSLTNPGPLTASEAKAGLPLARLALLFDAKALGQLRASRKWQQRCERLCQRQLSCNCAANWRRICQPLCCWPPGPPQVG
jgi:tRNA nucleotidyltransferase (CCA-adding enzyme)